MLISFLLWLALICAAPGAHAAPLIPQPHGPHAVGFQRFQQANGARPAQVLIWYPAAAPGQPLRYADYLATRLTALRIDRSDDDMRALRAQQAEQLTRRLGPAAAAVLGADMRATRDAPAAPGRFPVVVYAPGVGGPADENADLFEYLASHGWVVLSSVGLGTDGKDVDETLASVEPQVADLQALIQRARTLPNADGDRLALMGWSWGGMTILFAGERDSGVRALISLDGTREPALTRLIEVKRFRAPWLYVSRSPDTIAQINRAGIDTRFSLLNAAEHAAVDQLIAFPLQHADFVSRRLREASDAAYDEYSREEVRQALGWVALYVRQFLAAHLLDDPDAQRFLSRKPRELGAPAHAFRWERRSAAKRGGSEGP
ncbi:dienelactone hydrolase family protein [Inhella gelatinilytica]|uniref:Dienelactone hydrolase family protein n=1 Tax=Inhella gelatinilytica TaxID=2795030 RepID=A0A931NCC8_9BURK|nr:dienelactone hydrolase family protein [Inhella gelatinilytica]MBH9551434.1 dienelactone hydrolase family protein [Inhella gelatinilytica]